ncbi:TetR/AcrR family transcriptional regulator [Corynebacterium tapiri]|uniref:TetR/AcrR family transcriptional regulator n=1 Tax=Corynebacterium tapiri TaxID=1448266 RepID=A0A5C4U768_9CORY|nr:TetR/AcrR family transcriptional regulator [Corynebacterium tapiri]TNM00458.1 TetR/AcrR family transcriptional regulator [Corynebacterium tapiri]
MSGLREAKKAATSRKIAYAAAALSMDEGVDGLTVAAIASRAEVSVRTFHNYFPSREAALVAYCQLRVDDFAEHLAALPAQIDLIDAVEELLVHMLETDNQGLDTFPVMFRALDVLKVLAPDAHEQIDHKALDDQAALRLEFESERERELVMHLLGVTALSALEEFYDLPDPRTPEQGQVIAHRAFSVLRRLGA